MSNEKTEAESVADIVRRSTQRELHTDPKNDELIIFADKSIVPLEQYAVSPRRKRARLSLTDAPSFSRYVNEHSQHGTALFGKADLTGGKFMAVIDYHEANCDLSLPAPVLANDGAPAWGDHRAEFALTVTPEWARWTKLNGESLNQVQFSEFLEDNLPDIVSPAGITLLEIATTLQAKTDVGFRSAIRLSNGQHQLTYAENISASAGTEGTLEVPERFKLGLAPFVGSSAYEITARLRYRISSGKLTFTYQLERPHKIVEEAFKDVRAAIEEATGKVVLLGTLEKMGL